MEHLEHLEHPKHIIIAGGGTGGHLFPGIAIAQAFKHRNPNNRVLFVGTGKPFEVSALAHAGFPHRQITAEGLKRRGLKNQIFSMLKLPRGIFESLQILRDFQPDMVIGVGGYSSGPLAMAAWLMGIPIVLQEQNIIPGVTNRILSYFARQIYVSFRHTAKLPVQKVLFTGNPVRTEIRKSENQKSKIKNQKSKIKNQKSDFTVFILGGSQGAHSINMAVRDALNHIQNKEKLFFIHQTGAQDIEMLTKAYAAHGISCIVKPFFEDMLQQYQAADMLICRAGATTVAEITVMGKPAVFIPYPFAADNHQELNAKSLANQGAAEMILQKDLTGEKLAQLIEYYMKHPDTLEEMASRAKQFGKPEAAAVIAADCYDLLNKKCKNRKC